MVSFGDSNKDVAFSKTGRRRGRLGSCMHSNKDVAFSKGNQRGLEKCRGTKNSGVRVVIVRKAIVEERKKRWSRGPPRRKTPASIERRLLSLLDAWRRRRRRAGYFWPSSRSFCRSASAVASWALSGAMAASMSFSICTALSWKGFMIGSAWARSGSMMALILAWIS